MAPVHHLITRIDRFSTFIGHSLAWLTLAMVLLMSTIVAIRSLFGIGSIALQESVTYLHVGVFVLCLGYNLREGGHVRVDVFYSRFNTEQKAWVDALGGVFFLLPFALFLTFGCLQFVRESWSIRETSPDPGGLPLVYLLKTLLPVGGLLLALQALAEVLRALLALSWNGDTSRVREPS